MKFNLKNRPSSSRDYSDNGEWKKWFKGFEKELRQIKKECQETENPFDIGQRILIKEILDEKEA